MVLKRTKNEVRAALASNIMETCRQVLPDIEEIFVEGLLGVTLNRREIFLVNLSDIYAKDESGPPPKRKRGRRSGVSEYKKDYIMDDSIDCEDSPSKRSSGSLPIAVMVEPLDHEVSTHYIKEEEMLSPEDYSQPRVGRPPKQNFPELEDDVIQTKSSSSSKVNTSSKCLNFVAASEQLEQEPVLDLSMDKRSTQNFGGSSVGPLNGSPNDTSHRRKRGRPRKISSPVHMETPKEDAAPVALDMTSYGSSHNRDAFQPISQSDINSDSRLSDSFADQPKDFSGMSFKSHSSGTGLDLNMNSDLSFNNKATSVKSEPTSDFPGPSSNFSGVSMSNNCSSSHLPQDAIDQSESDSNSQSQAFMQMKQETNQSEGSVMSPGPSENSFQSGPVFPHLEEYDEAPFNSSIEERSFNDSNVEPSSANDSFQDSNDDSDKIELTSTGRPKRKTSMSPWVRQFFNITTGGGESRTVQIKATQTCPICNKVFSAGSHLKRHYLVTHTDSSKFQCRICTKRFGSADHLKRHMGTHSEDRKYKCHLCSRKFNVKYRLTEHLSEKHGGLGFSNELHAADDQSEASTMATEHNEVAMEMNDSMDGNISLGNSTIPT